jgi:hypothetical protein
MNNLGKLQKLTLGLIVALVWFEILCFVLIFVGSIFKWSFLSDTFSVGFFSAFGIGIGALIALAILHMTLTLNSVSTSLSKIAKDQEAGQAGSKSSNFFALSIFGALASILLIVLFLWYGEAQVNRHKIKIALNGVESVAKSSLANKLVELINKDATVKEILEVRDAMSRNLEEGGLSVLAPVNKIDKTVYYEISPWWYSENNQDKPISQASLRIFVPYGNEKHKFNELILNKKPFTSLESNSLRAFYPVVVNGNVECILLLDTSRQASDKYLLSRSSAKERRME